MELKESKVYEEQVDLIKKKGFIIPELNWHVIVHIGMGHRDI